MRYVVDYSEYSEGWYLASTNTLDPEPSVILENTFVNQSLPNYVEFVMYVDNIYSSIVNNTNEFWSYAVLTGHPLILGNQVLSL